jgi:protein phosphatase 2C family protein 2/3
MEDRVLLADLTQHPVFAFVEQRAVLAAVFDGHGGEEAAQHAAQDMQSYLVSQGSAALQEQPAAALAHAISLAESDLLSAWRPQHGHAAGTTVCMLLLLDSVLHVAHAGDSRAVLSQGSRAVVLTQDHKPTCPSEAARIRAADPHAQITPDGYCYDLGVSRGLGSAHIKADPSKPAYVATPEVTSMQLTAADNFVIVGSDGLFDAVSSQEAVAAARRSLAVSNDAAAAAQVLAERAQKMGSSDNISVVVLLLHDRGIVLPKSNSRLFARAAAGAAAAAAAGESGPEVARAAADNERGSGGGAAPHAV